MPHLNDYVATRFISGSWKLVCFGLILAGAGLGLGLLSQPSHASQNYDWKITQLERRLDQLDRQVNTVERRLMQVENRGASSPAPGPAAPTADIRNLEARELYLIERLDLLQQQLKNHQQMLLELQKKLEGQAATTPPASTPAEEKKAPAKKPRKNSLRGQPDN